MKSVRPYSSQNVARDVLNELEEQHKGDESQASAVESEADSVEHSVDRFTSGNAKKVDLSLGRVVPVCYESSVLDRIGQVVLTTRNAAGRSREDIAREAGIQAQALESLEEGKPGLTTTQLTAVARALLLDPVALLSGRKEERPVPSVFLRHQPAQDFHDQDHAVLDEALEESRAFNRLRELRGRSALGIPSNVFQAREAPTDSADAPARDGYKVAREARRWLGQTKEPFADVRELIESRFGATVVLRKLASTKVTAATVLAGTAASIVLAASDWQRANNPLLTRVILAHELCHALVDPLVGGLQIVLDESNDRKTNAAEQRARAFAAEFLLPLEGCRACSDRHSQRRMVTRRREWSPQLVPISVRRTKLPPITFAMSAS